MDIEISTKKLKKSVKDHFYTQKRGINRKAEQISKSFDCDVLVFIYKKENKSLFKYQTSKNFDIE